MKKLGLYLHIPFCLQKCLYCDFCSFAALDGELVEGYVSRLCAELQKYSSAAENMTVDTVYFGGGTPTLLPICEFEKIMESVSTSFSLADDCEISSECNPATADREYLGELRKLGVNRLSIGLQSAQEEELMALGRVHSYEDFVNTYTYARAAGFENISADLMYGIPQQTLASFEDSIDKLISIEPEHISAYGLKIEEGTPFGKVADKLTLPDEDTEWEMYELLGNKLAKSGYDKYEISNFARAGYESRHNLKYWTGEDYLGFGVSAHSLFLGERFANSRDISAYISGRDITDTRRTIEPEEIELEYVMLRMRLSSGVEHKDFERRFGKSFMGCYGERLRKYLDAGFVLSDGERTRFSDKGFFVSNYILSDIL